MSDCCLTSTERLKQRVHIFPFFPTPTLIPACSYVRFQHSNQTGVRACQINFQWQQGRLSASKCPLSGWRQKAAGMCADIFRGCCHNPTKAAPNPDVSRRSWLVSMYMSVVRYGNYERWMKYCSLFVSVITSQHYDFAPWCLTRLSIIWS